MMTKMMIEILNLNPMNLF